MERRQREEEYFLTPSPRRCRSPRPTPTTPWWKCSSSTRKPKRPTSWRATRNWPKTRRRNWKGRKKKRLNAESTPSASSAPGVGLEMLEPEFDDDACGQREWRWGGCGIEWKWRIWRRSSPGKILTIHRDSVCDFYPGETEGPRAAAVRSFIGRNRHNRPTHHAVPPHQFGRGEPRETGQIFPFPLRLCPHVLRRTARGRDCALEVADPISPGIGSHFRGQGGGIDSEPTGNVGRDRVPKSGLLSRAIRRVFRQIRHALLSGLQLRPPPHRVSQSFVGENFVQCLDDESTFRVEQSVHRDPRDGKRHRVEEILSRNWSSSWSGSFLPCSHEMIPCHRWKRGKCTFPCGMSWRGSGKAGKSVTAEDGVKAVLLSVELLEKLVVAYSGLPAYTEIFGPFEALFLTRRIARIQSWFHRNWKPSPNSSRCIVNRGRLSRFRRKTDGLVLLEPRLDDKYVLIFSPNQSINQSASSPTMWDIINQTINQPITVWFSHQSIKQSINTSLYGFRTNQSNNQTNQCVYLFSKKFSTFCCFPRFDRSKSAKMTTVKRLAHDKKRAVKGAKRNCAGQPVHCACPTGGADQEGRGSRSESQANLY